jgi:hypothetical protein
VKDETDFSWWLNSGVFPIDRKGPPEFFYHTLEYCNNPQYSGLGSLGLGG